MKKHEWELVQYTPDMNVHYCKHCLLDRLTIKESAVLYRIEQGNKWESIEPDCIERPDKEAGKDE